MAKVLGAAALALTMGLAACQLSSQALPPGPAQVVSLALQSPGQEPLSCELMTRYDRSTPGEVKPFTELDCLSPAVIADFKKEGIQRYQAIWLYGVPPTGEPPQTGQEAARRLRPAE